MKIVALVVQWAHESFLSRVEVTGTPFFVARTFVYVLHFFTSCPNVERTGSITQEKLNSHLVVISYTSTVEFGDFGLLYSDWDIRN